MTHSSRYENFNGKVVVLTGASRGIGKAVADALVANGAHVVIGDLLEKEGQAVVDAYNSEAKSKVAAFLRTDVTKYKDNQDLFKLAESEFGGVDHAVLNAGIALNSNSYFSEMDDDLEEKIIDVNTTAVIKGTKVALLHMAKRGGGSIIHVASVAGIVASPSLASYNASKHGVIGYTRSFTLMPYICNVRVNAICPFYVDTDLVSTQQKNETETNTSLRKLIYTFEFTPMSVVVEGALQLMADDTKNTETVLCLPEGNIPMERPTLPGSLTTKEKTESLKQYATEVSIPLAKSALKGALQRYGI
ncbi:uncharacterized protein ATC70_012632 [Mucor velutinosus]|uniref:Uncharacterized protein n=1 Tax=Mucor velutinosus TaxID=708070 RepID=A0AAN7HY02_9FUNG|nr:hypothetical protein ATC70_012632 [Mucor velutinosus]